MAACTHELAGDVLRGLRGEKARETRRPLSLAPMVGLTTFPMRLWLHIVSQPEAMTTPFLRVTQVVPGASLPGDWAPELTVLHGVLPYALTPQLLAADPDHFLRASHLLPAALSPYLELNCGCPSPNSAGRYAGSGILAAPDVFAATLARLADRLGPGRLAVKMRLGYSEPEEFGQLLRCLAGLPLGRLTVHGRTRAAGYRGAARWEPVQQAAACTDVPAWLSGDVLGSDSWEAAQRAAPGAAGGVIGRGAMRNPWIFTEMRTGKAVAIGADALANALLCYLLLQQLWQVAPQKLLSRVASGRIGGACGVDADAWQRLAAELSSVVWGRAVVLGAAGAVPPMPVLGICAGRLRFLWSYLRSSLPACLQGPELLRARQPDDFFAGLLTAWGQAEAAVLRHDPAWDTAYAK